MIGGAKPLPDNDITLNIYIYIYIYIYNHGVKFNAILSLFLGWLGAEVKILIFCYQPSNKKIIISFIYGLFEEKNFNFLKFLPKGPYILLVALAWDRDSELVFIGKILRYF